MTNVSLECTWEEFKRMAKEFHEAAPSMNIDELDNAWKCLGLGYLNMSEDIWRVSASVLLQMESRVFLLREHQLGEG